MRAKLLEVLLWIYCYLIGSKKTTFYHKEMKQALRRGEKVYIPSKRILKKYHIDFKTVYGMGCGYLSKDSSKSNITVLYLHGGAYARPPMVIHWNFIAKLQEKTKASFIVPIYPKAPHHTVDESFEKLKLMYLEIIERDPNQEIVIMGDSSGGGFVIAFAQYLQAHNIPQPKRYIAFCPWMDITLSNPKIKAIESRDPVFRAEGLRHVGKVYAGYHNPKEYIVSPLYGTMVGCKELILLTGTKDIFYPDIDDFYQREKLKGAEIKLHYYRNQVHDFQLFPVRLTKKVVYLTVNYILH